MFDQLFLDKVCCNLTALRWVACFVIIRPLRDESLVLGHLVGRSQLVDYWFNQLMFLISFFQSFSWVVQDGIIFLNNHASISDLHQNCLYILWDHLDSLNPCLFYSTFMKTPLHYWDHSFWRIIPSSMNNQMSKADVNVPRVRPYCV